jgi:hypothetical protein
LTLGGYAEESHSPEAAALSPEERKTFKRLFIGALVLVAIGLGFLVSFWWSGAPAGRTAEQPVPTGTALESTKEAPALFPVRFDVAAIPKEDQFAGGHAHALVRLDNQAVFIIRDEGGYPSTIERAQAVTDNLSQAIANFQRDPGAEFRVENRPEGPTIVQVMPNLMGEEKLSIVTIVEQDVTGYNRRSHRSVTATELATWWLNRLKDRVNLFVKGEAPRLTVADEDGRILADLYEQARKVSPGGKVTSEALYSTLRSLPPEQRRLLSDEGVRTIPHHSEDHEQ